MSNYATKSDLKNATGVDTSDFAKKTDLVNLKSDLDKLDIDKSRKVSTNLNNLKSKVDKLDAEKLVPVLADFSKLSDVVKNDAVKKTEYNELVKNVNNISTTATSNFVKKTDYNTKINKIENEINDHDHAKYITTQEFNKLTADNFTARLKQAKFSKQK